MTDETPTLTKSQTKSRQVKRQRERLKADVARLRGVLGKQGKLLTRLRKDLELLLDASRPYVADDPDRHARGDWIAHNDRLLAARAQATATLDALAATRGQS